MQQPNVTVYGSSTCADTTRARKWLDDHGVAYEYKDVEDDPSYSAYIADLNNGKRVMPTLRLDNQTLVNPSAEELHDALTRRAS